MVQGVKHHLVWVRRYIASKWRGGASWHFAGHADVCVAPNLVHSSVSGHGGGGCEELAHLVGSPTPWVSPRCFLSTLYPNFSVVRPCRSSVVGYHVADGDLAPVSCVKKERGRGGIFLTSIILRTVMTWHVR
jgi:hypothetical protein